MRLSRRRFGIGLGALALGGTARRASAGGAFLRLAHPFPPTSSVHRILIEQAEEIRAATDFQADLEIYETGTLGGPADLLPLLWKGVLDFALLPSALLVDSGLGLDILGRNDLFESFDHFRRVAGSDAERAVQRLLASQDIGLVGTAWFGAEHVLSQEPVFNPRDLAGMKLRLGGASGAEVFFRALGVSPIRINASETYSAIEVGLLDGVVSTLPWAREARLLEANSALLATPLGGSVGWLLAPRWRLEELDPFVREVLQEQLGVAMERVSFQSEREAADVLEEARSRGYEITAFDPETWAEIRASIHDRLRPDLSFEAEQISERLRALEAL